MKYILDHIRGFIAIVTVFFSFAIYFMLFFVNIPTNNQRLIDTITGFIIGSGFTSVFQWLFGTSKNETDKVLTETTLAQTKADTQQMVAKKVADGDFKQEININQPSDDKS